MSRPSSRRLVHLLTACLAVLAIGLSLSRLHAASAGVSTERIAIDGIPATVFRPDRAEPGPVVVIAHGFAGSQQLMQSFALALARNGYLAVTFDFAGHGRNPAPLTGSITEVSGATRTLVAEVAKVAAVARGLGDGRLAVLGHSMASDIIVRFAQETPDIAATIAVSMFSPAVTADSPRNLLVIVGDWEGFLKAEALRAVGLLSAPAVAQPGVTYGSPATGNARRAAFSAGVEHVAVLYSTDSQREAISWLDQTFGETRNSPMDLASRGPWILLLLAGAVLMARPLAASLPRVAEPAAGAGLAWRRLWPWLLLPTIATPLLLRVLPTHFLPVLVGDYLAAHFALYGLLTAAGLWWVRRQRAPTSPPQVSRRALFGATLAVTAYGFVAIVWPIDTYVTSFLPGPQRIPLVLAMLVGTLSFFIAAEMLTRGEGAARGAYAAAKLAFMLSLAIAVALDFERLFFLLIIVPVIVLFFLVYGLVSAWTYRRTGHPLVAGIANAVAFAWAIGVTFPLLAG
jgi:pimeloyl-ACP methyl ester carboxylesterase